MGYRTLNLEPSASRLTMTIGVDRKAVSFNKAICAKMGIGPDSKITFLVDDRGFLAINVLDKESPTGIGLRRSSKKCGTLKLYSSALIRHIVPGRYHITGRDGAFWLTGIKYNEE